MNKPEILVVDDDFINREVIKGLIGQEYTLSFAKSSGDMIKKLEENEKVPDLVLLDVMMPNEDGYSAARRLNRMDRYKEIPVVFVTARSDAEDVQKGFAAGGQDYVFKPIDRLILITRINHVLERKKKENELIQETLTDPLTQLKNRRYFKNRGDEQLEYFKRNNGNFSVAMIDIDNFKLINDTYGHSVGDDILIGFSNILKNGIRPYDIIARYGGEEFTIIFVECNKNKAAKILERIKYIMGSKTFKAKNDNIKITFSAGVSDFIEQSSEKEIFEIDELLDLADQRMYNAKKNGRNLIKID